MAAPAFSRLQLAAALIEYDNDPDDPNASYRSAHDSAIFAHLRQNGLMRPPVSSRRSQTDYIGVSVPSEKGSLGGRESALGSRQSRGSLDALRNPFGNGADEAIDDDENDSHENLEVDLTSWGLDAFMPKEKGKGKGKQRADRPPTVHDDGTRPQHSRTQSDFDSRSSARNRSSSLGNMAPLEDGTYPDETRRRSFGAPLDSPQLAQDMSYSQVQDSVPFPSKSVRSPSPAPSQALSDGGRNRSHSNATLQTALIVEDNPFAVEPPKHASRFDPKAAMHARTLSNASMGSRVLLENDGVSVMTGRTGQPRDRFYSTVELLRPKVLVMPSPLQNANTARPPSPVKGREGFEITTDGPPLPPGARSSRSMSNLGLLGPSSTLSPPVPSNSFIPNPRTSLTLSQLTFRNQLMVGGQRDVAYADLDQELPRATEEGEQVNAPPIESVPDFPLPVEESSKAGRPAGKLYGTSLIDQLENRKLEMRSKQRVFAGDQRPSMMARGQLQRSSTLIDPASLQAPPAQNRTSTFGIPDNSHNLTRRNSANAKTLLNFDEDTPGLRPQTKMINSRSVFGVDTLWEKEMAKLKEIEAREKEEAEARAKEEALLESTTKKKKGKRKNKQNDSTPEDTPSPQFEESIPRVSAEPPILPTIPKAVRRPPPVVDDEESEESADEDDAPARPPASGGQAWGSSDDEEEGPRRTTGTGPRYPARAPRRDVAQNNADSDEDLPLSAALDKVVRRTRTLDQDDSDEEKPLAALLRKQSNTTSPPKGSLGGRLGVNDDEEDEDNQPLGLRASRYVPPAGDDDDTPLALHPEQQRRTQYQMMAQAQQQHQFMMQAQNNMFFNPAMMGSGFFGPQVAPPVMMMQPPVPIPSPPPLHDSAKFGRVDRWRHDVAVEGNS